MQTKKILSSKRLLQISSFIFFLLITIAVQSQERAQADVSITSVTLTAVRTKPQLPVNQNPAAAPAQPGPRPKPALPSGDVLKCNIAVFSQNDDDANQAMLVVVVPVEVSIVSLPANATIFKAGATSPFAGYIVFTLGNIGVGQTVNVEFSFTRSAYGNTVGAYAYSASPDPNPANNYKDASF